MIENHQRFINLVSTILTQTKIQNLRTIARSIEAQENIFDQIRAKLLSREFSVVLGLAQTFSFSKQWCIIQFAPDSADGMNMYSLTLSNHGLVTFLTVIPDISVRCEIRYLKLNFSRQVT